MNINNKGAMFGLDARIALAIFGALSVISGAALFSAIQESKVTYLVAEYSEIDKAIESYLLDTGSYIPFSSVSGLQSDGYLATDELITSSNSLWKGPYMPYENDGSDDSYISHTIYGRVYLFAANSSSNWTNPTLSSNTCKKSSSSCNIYKCIYGVAGVSVNGAVPLALMKAIEFKFDATASIGTSDNTNSVKFNSNWLCVKSINYPPANSPIA